MQCPNCGSENRDAAKFCDECGFPLGGAIARFTMGIPGSGSSPDDESNSGKVDSQTESPGKVLELLLEEDAGGQPESPAEERLTDVAQDDDEDGMENASSSHRDGAFDAERENDESEDKVSSEDIVETYENDEVDAEAADEHGDGLEGEAPVAPSCESKSERDLEDITEIIGMPKSVNDATRTYNEDDFAGFTKHADDGYSFSDPIGYDGDGNGPLNMQGPGFTMKMPRVEADPAEKGHDFMASSATPKKSHAKAIGGVIAALAVVAIAAVVTFNMGLWGGKIVPDVSNMTETDARAILESSGFSVRSTQVKSDDTEGLVLVMDPEAGSRVQDGSEIIIHVATARLIPDIIGKTSEEAAAILAEAGYDNIRYEKVKSEGEENLVLSVSPEVGSRAKSSMEIVVGVSEAYRVPDVSGMTWDDAFATLEGEGFVADVVYVNTEYYPEGTIIGTTPDAGTVVQEGSYVAINIAQSRATLLTQLTQNLLAAGGTVTLNGYNFTIDALNSVSYIGNDTVAYSFTGRPYVTLFGETIHGTSQTVNGQVVWSPGNEVVSIT